MLDAFVMTRDRVIDGNVDCASGDSRLIENANVRPPHPVFVVRLGSSGDVLGSLLLWVAGSLPFQVPGFALCALRCFLVVVGSFCVFFRFAFFAVFVALCFPLIASLALLSLLCLLFVALLYSLCVLCFVRIAFFAGWVLCFSELFALLSWLSLVLCLFVVFVSLRSLLCFAFFVS